MKKYPKEPMNGVIIERVRVVRSAIAGDPWDFMVLWESGKISQLSKNGIEKFRPCHENRVRSAWEEENEECPEKVLQSAREMDEWARREYGCQCRGCDIQTGGPIRIQGRVYPPGPECVYAGEANESR
jgi:hypothetical protein